MLNKIRWFLLSLGLVLALYLFLPHSTPPVLEVWDDKNNRLISSYDIKLGDILGIKFIHSYDKGPVWEYFIMQEDGSFLLHEVAFAVASYDARDQTFPKIPSVLEDGVVYLKDIDTVYTQAHSEFLIRVPYTVPQWILLPDKTVELADLASPGTLLKIKIKNEGET